MDNFYTTSDAVKQIVKGLTLTKSLYVSSIVIGEAHTGKKTLLKHIFPDTPVVCGSDPEAVETALKQNDEIIINRFELLPNKESLDFENKRILATADYIGNHKVIDSLFAFIYTMPPLSERPDDILYLKRRFLREGAEIYDIDAKNYPIDTIPNDIRENCKSLKRAVYFHLAMHIMKPDDIEQTLYRYFYETLEGNNAYKKNLGIFETPLIRAGLDKYGSQLKLSKVLGINRNTLRKKIHEHRIDRL